MKKIKKALLATVLLCVALGSFVACKDDTKAEYTFNTNGGPAISMEEVEIGTEYVLPVPEWEGYSFEGWYTTADFSGSPVTTVTVSEDKTYYAKWEKLYAIELDLNGGSLAETKFYLKAGENVYEFMQEHIPTAKDGCVFGGWFNGESELAEDAKMTTDGIRLTAKYKTAYTVEIWQEKIDGSGYEKVAEDIIGYEYAGTVFESKQTLAGFREVSQADTVTKLTISETASQNVFKHYFNRETHTVTFNANYPDGSAGEEKKLTLRYGEEDEVFSDYTFDGYCLIGWAKSKDGEVVYKTNYIESRLYNKDSDSEAVSADKMTPEEDMTLYAVWLKGYTDLFGADDYLFIPDEDGKIIYLLRGGVFVEGEYNANKKEFLFINMQDSIILEGKLYDGDKFAYWNEDRAGIVSTLYQTGVGLLKTNMIYFDAYNGLTYSVQDENGKTTQSVGTYVVDEETGLYVATFTEGELKGQSRYFLVGYVTENGTRKSAFMLRGPEYDMGVFYRYVIENNELVCREDVYQLTLDGFGNAVYNNGSSEASYIYTMENDTITLKNSSGYVVGVARTLDEYGMNGYIFYDENFDKTFELSSGATLTLDGMYNATYTNGNTRFSVYYSSSQSVTGDTLVKLENNGKTYTFLISEVTAEVPVEGGEEGETETVTTYVAEEKLSNYGEYICFVTANSSSYQPMLVINDTGRGRASLYGVMTSGAYEKVSEGTYLYDQKLGYYVYTAEQYYDANVRTTPVDLSTVKTFVFQMGDGNTFTIDLLYWYSMTTEEGTTEYELKYTAAEGTATLTLISGIAFYEDNDTVVIGTCFADSGAVTLSTGYGNIYLELDKETMTFIRLQYAPFKMEFLHDDKASLYFDGKGGVTYTEPAKDGEEAAQYVGTFALTGKKTIFGNDIFKFTAEGKTFEFIQADVSSGAYIAVYDQTNATEYLSDNGGKLEVDGFEYMARYTDFNGAVYEGFYAFEEESVIVLQEDLTYFYFDLTENNGFTARGTEYGNYLWVDNQSVQEKYFVLDGYGVLKVESFDDGESVEGTYQKDGDVYTLTYTENGTSYKLVGELGWFEDYGAFIVSHKEVVRTFVNEKDWSILILDDLGNATKYGADGKKELGTYMLITDEILYYVNASLTDACLYEYDVENATATPVKLTARGYYTEDLKSLLFSKYGFAQFSDTETIYYYTIENSRVTIYHQDPTNENANEYGFVAEDFGLFESVKEYNGETYYSNNDYAIMFKRLEATKDKYPVNVSENEKYALEDLIFTPSAGENYTTEGLIRLDGQDYDCYVTRNVDKDGNVELYVTIGYLRFDITVSYHGEEAEETNENTYEVTRARYIYTLPSYSYLNLWYNIYYFYGSSAANSYPNEFGAISEVYEFNEEGVRTDEYLTGWFGANSGAYDLNGELITFENGEYRWVQLNGLIMVEFVAEDGYTYRLYYKRQDTVLGESFVLTALTRLQELTTEDGYCVKVEKLIASDELTLDSSFYDMVLEYNETAIKMDYAFMKGSNIYYIERTKDEDGKITATTYYKIVLEEGTEENLKAPALYESATVTKETVTVVYTAEGDDYVDIAKDGVMLIYLNDEIHLVTSCRYDADTSTYTVTTHTLKTYTVKVENGVAVITEVIEVEPETPDQAE